MNEFINHTNHPSARWEAEQLRAAEAYGTVMDMPFPQIPAMWGAEEVCRLAAENARAIIARRPAAVLVQGEFTYTYALVAALAAAGIVAFSACSERHVRERVNEAGETVRESRFVFCHFRTYCAP